MWNWHIMYPASHRYVLISYLYGVPHYTNENKIISLGINLKVI